MARHVCCGLLIPLQPFLISVVMVIDNETYTFCIFLLFL